ncbi:hypothetical protein SAMN05444166_5662 [Singulisphaera sp. GP187]|uniref:hypothetical protein n=1 Tax=Singulisphaera sp. GP187 TaxID=1882752 RepID=UPI00092B6C53|nr:hypothetical protein [Singulisphaera sp. GP187]SIO58392.1 hypothetical protein SAMN05444166_5662 [Singulisphaera sp. GP187]
MKIVGGPKHGEEITMAGKPGGPEFVPPDGFVIEYEFVQSGKVNVKFGPDRNPKPSVPGQFERYQTRGGSWHYVEPEPG